MTKEKFNLAHELTQFRGVYCSGFFVPDPAITTALALLFERVYFMNHEELVLEFAKESRMPYEKVEQGRRPRFKIEDDKIVPNNDPYSSLTPEQKERAYYYKYLTELFFNRYADLHPKVFDSMYMQPNRSIHLTVLNKEGRVTVELEAKPGKAFLLFQNGLEEDLNERLAEGYIPILARMIPHTRSSIETVYVPDQKVSNTSAQVAAALALCSVAMVLPATREANAETILEARAKLRDHLPPFWSSMLKLSIELRERLDEKAKNEDWQRECEYIVTTTVRPALIDLVNKLEKERKQWFYKILSPLAKGLSVIAGRPPVTSIDLISASLKLGANIALDVSDQIRKVDAMKREGGLAYLLELHKTIRRTPLSEGKNV